jgi:putative sugar O-methyltransferase
MYLDFMEEPTFGNPITINYNNKKISFALLNSILEVDVILKNIELKGQHSFLELGAGSGRTCIAMCKTKKNIKYIICDIPPALYISQENVSREFPEKEIFKFQSFESFDDVKEDILSADIVFISPEQLQLMPDKFINTSIAIDCLHEMTNESVMEYFEQFNRISDTLYFKSQVKQWADTSHKSLDIDTYPIRDNWTKVLHERSIIPNDYFNAIYKM